MHRDTFGNIVIEAWHHGDSAITARRLQIPTVVLPTSVAFVARVFHLIQAGIEGIGHLEVTGSIVNQHGLRLGNNFLTGGNIHLSLDNLTPHINPDTLEVRKQSPVAAGIAIHVTVTEVLEVLGPDKFWSVPHGTAVHTGLLHHGAYTGTAWIFLAVLLAQHLSQHVVVAAVVVTYTIVLGQTGDKRTEAHTLVVIETAAMGVLVEEQDSLRVFLTGSQEFGFGLQLCQRVGIEMVDTTTPAHREKAAILMRHLHKVGKEIPTTGLGHGTQVACIAKGPELLGIVPSKEVGEGLEEILESLQVVILNMGVTTRGRLTREPHIVLLTDSGPRLIGSHCITRHTIHAGLRVKLTRERQVQTNIRFDICWYQINNFLWVSTVPHVNVNQPQRMLAVDRTALLRRNALHGNDTKQHHHQE